MMVFRKIGLSIVFILIIVYQIFAYPVENNLDQDGGFITSSDSIPVSEIQIPVSSYLFAIEVNNFAQSITDVHRLSSLLIHSNQHIPVNFDFRSFADIQIPSIYSSPVPIFIRGHALLN